MSLKYEVLKWLAKASGLKKFWAGNSAEDILEKRRKGNAKVKNIDLKDEDFNITKTSVMGFPVLEMIHKQSKHQANLYIYGGGMTKAIGPTEAKLALKFAKATGLDVYIPCYPLCTDYPLTKSYEMILKTYKEMLKDYKPENISVLGYSSGGNLALGLVAYMNDGHENIPMPAHIMAISPGNCVGSDEEWQRMLQLDKKDVVTPASFMKTAEEIMKHGDNNVPDYMLWLQKGNYSKCPKVTFIYGSDECLYACFPAIEETMKKYGVNYQLIVGDGMFHCYPMFSMVCKEAKDGWNQLIELMKAR